MFEFLKYFVKHAFGSSADHYESNASQYAADARRHHFEVVAKERNKAQQVASNLTVGELSKNVNWVGIEHVGKYLSPIGNDRKHKIILTRSVRHSGNVHIATIECTNAIYSEWVQSLCETMWHIEHKVLEDIHGNKYPLGQMLEMSCSIEYV